MAANTEMPEGGGARTARRTRKRAVITGDVSSNTASATDNIPITRKGRPPLFSGLRHADVTMFLRQFIMLVESGTPILRALKQLGERSDDGDHRRVATRKMITGIAEHVEQGNALWQAFDRDPNFDEVFVSLIKASEASGTLVTVLRRVVNYRERHELLRKRVAGGMLYPAVLLFACLGVILFIAKFVMPEFESMFLKMGDTAQVPVLTQRFMSATTFIGTWWWMFFVILILMVGFYKFWWINDEKRRLMADRWKLHIPIIGSILRKNAVVEMTQLLALLLRSGLSMMETLLLVRDAIHNRAVAEIVQHVRDSVEQGAGMEKPLREASGIIPSVVADMMVTGEESGRLDSISEQIAETYEQEVNIAVGTLGEALQPILTVVIGFLVVMLMLAVFVPILGMLETLGSVGA